MKNMNYNKKYHYILKYILLGLPIALLLLSNISYNNAFTSLQDIIYDMMVSLRSFTLNDWYNTFINVLGFTTTDKISYILLSYPLYVFYIYLFDIVLDILCFIPKLAHKFIYKLVND